MISHFATYLTRGFTFLLEQRSLVIPLFLILFIPLAFLWSGERFLDVSTERSERLEKDRIGMLHDGLALALRSGARESGFLGDELIALSHANPDLVTVEILHHERGSTSVVARIGQEFSSSYADFERLAALNTKESIIFEEFRQDVRHWVGVRAIAEDQGQILYTIRTDLSMRAVDEALKGRLHEAYATLIILVAMILLLLWRQVRIIDYARLYTELKSVHGTMSLFVNMTAHELRTPLTAIRGYASMIREDSEATLKSKDYAAYIETSSSQLIELISDLLDLARLQSGKMIFAYAPVDIGNVLHHVATLLQPLASKYGLTLKVEPYEIANVTVVGDEKRLIQVFTNVISNALKYTKEGGVSISLARSGEWYEIRIKDTGMGIAAEDQRKLFAPYFRVESPEVAAKTGTGLGMWITKKMIEEMKGTIDVESIKGVGTHIVVRFKSNG